VKDAPVGLTARVERWRTGGETVRFRDREIYVRRRDGRAPALVLLHGFPSSSYDWRRLLEVERAYATIAFDFLGFGLSEKPRDHEYSLMWQADLAEELVRRYADGPVFVVAHDMGTSVATELMARELEGRETIAARGALLFNGSILLDRARPTLGQRMLRGHAGPLFASLSSGRFFKAQLGSVFSRAHPLTADEASDQWALYSHRAGNRIGHRLIHYMDERERLTERWHGAFRDWPKPLSLAWGMRDPVATSEVLDGLAQLRPPAPVERLEELGHYPQIEAPERIAHAIRSSLAHLSG
jgi:pimeloyl-ACP methyl ester carboxylesterase